MKREEQKQPNKFSQFMSDLLLMPIWIKQLMYVYLKYRLEEELTPQYLSSFDIGDIFQLHKSVLTYKGKKEVENPTLNLPKNHYIFLQDSIDSLTVAESTIKNDWNLYEVSNIFLDCLDKELVAMPQSVKMIEMVRYLSGKTRIGEYFLRIGQISQDQLSSILEQQEKIKRATNEQVGTATILVNMGYIPESAVKAVLRYKEESRKRFMVENISSTNSKLQADDESASIKATNERLLKENKILKLQLRKLLNLSE